MGIPFATSEEACAFVRTKTDTVVLAFSRGKDSICAWLQLRRYWTAPGQIIPITKVFPNKAGTGPLRFEEESLRYYEQFFGTRIYRIFHHEYIRQLAYLLMQPPDRRDAIARLQAQRLVQVLDNADRDKQILRIVKGAWICTGLRMWDSLQRQRTIKKNGSVYPTRKLFYPIFDWKNARQYDELEQAGVRLPLDYLYGGRSFEGLSYEMVEMMKTHYPDDYAAALFWFPMVALYEKQLAYRTRMLQRHGHAT